MNIDFDPVKSARNERERQLPFEKAAEFQWESAVVWQDTRKEYPETRMIGLGYLGKRLHVLCFVSEDDGIRVISLRKANAREQKRYETQTTY
ncbi:MAG: BrnT family toxin [Bdellovibrionales bacterium]